MCTEVVDLPGARMARLVDRFTTKYSTTSCDELTKSFPISSFATLKSD